MATLVDLFYIALASLFFVVCWLLVRACEKL